ncbi:hypothetical protein HK097_009871 [Rhizophlyctis rosea]|uniref:Uncharacterized protein n=1 Tax=Rhizophlyctis rosea TaxID=64517 RepID=A0AAD5S8B9_9FUNG|nr:hypothetical protein HK097_009871 [Rhizophlyctis rosea]
MLVRRRYTESTDLKTRLSKAREETESKLPSEWDERNHRNFEDLKAKWEEVKSEVDQVL